MVIDKPECVTMLDDVSDAQQRLSLSRGQSCENAFVYSERLFYFSRHIARGPSRRWVARRQFS
jgi:hypothetical protein